MESVNNNKPAGTLSHAEWLAEYRQEIRNTPPTQCYNCNFSTKVIPCTNCGHDAPLVYWGQTKPMMPHNQPFPHL